TEDSKRAASYTVYLFLGGMISLAIIARLIGYHPLFAYIFGGYLIIPFLPLFKARVRSEYNTEKDISAVRNEFQGRDSIVMQEVCRDGVEVQEEGHMFTIQDRTGIIPSLLGYVSYTTPSPTTVEWTYELTRFRIQLWTFACSISSQENQCHLDTTVTTIRLPLIVQLKWVLDTSSTLAQYGYTLESSTLRPALT
ncbi:MAG: hypothetical protein ABEI97_00880, partial [Candidatus Nanohaloarchaea archaeon]